MLAFVYALYAGASVIKAPPESAGAVSSQSANTRSFDCNQRGVLLTIKDKGVCDD